jgi:hypothetical protein
MARVTGIETKARAARNELGQPRVLGVEQQKDARASLIRQYACLRIGPFTARE